MKEHEKHKPSESSEEQEPVKRHRPGIFYTSILNRLHRVTREEEEQFRKDMQEANPGRSDIFAMIGTAFVVLVLPSILVLCVLCLIMLLLFRVI